MMEWTDGERRGTTCGGVGGPVQGIMGMGNSRAGEVFGIHVSHASHESQPPCRGQQDALEPNWAQRLQLEAAWSSCRQQIMKRRLQAASLHPELAPCWQRCVGRGRWGFNTVTPAYPRVHLTQRIIVNHAAHTAADETMRAVGKSDKKAQPSLFGYIVTVIGSQILTSFSNNRYWLGWF